jgi:nuclear receptor interaction protein
MLSGGFGLLQVVLNANSCSWSRSGQLLASGSDDQHLNIYSYQPESSNAPFALNTTVFTGHKANIFSVKFMPQ